MADIFSEIRGFPSSDAPISMQSAQFMLAGLSSAVDEKEGAGTSLGRGPRTTIPFFSGIMSQISDPRNSESVTSGATILLDILLASGALSVAVLRSRSEATCECLFKLLQNYAQNDEICSRSLSSLGKIAKAQDSEAWSRPSALKIIQALLVFSVDPREKIREAAKISLSESLSSASKSCRELNLTIQNFFRRELSFDSPGDVFSISIFISESLSAFCTSIGLSWALPLYAILIQFWALLQDPQKSSIIGNGSSLSRQLNLVFQGIVKCGRTLLSCEGSEKERNALLDVFAELEGPSSADLDTRMEHCRAITSAAFHSKDQWMFSRAMDQTKALLIELSTSEIEKAFEYQKECFEWIDNLLQIDSLLPQQFNSVFKELLSFRFRKTWKFVISLLDSHWNRPHEKSLALEDYLEIIDLLFNMYLSQENNNTKDSLPDSLIEPVRKALGTALREFGALSIVQSLSFPSISSLSWILYLSSQNSSDFETLQHFLQLYQLIEKRAEFIDANASNMIKLAVWATLPSFVGSEKSLQASKDEWDRIISLLNEILPTVVDAELASSLGRGIGLLFKNVPSEILTVETVKSLENLSQAIIDCLLGPLFGKERYWLIESIRALSRCCSEDAVSGLFKRLLKSFLQVDSEDHILADTLLDILSALVPSLRGPDVLWIYRTAIMHIHNSEGTIQKKGYRVLESTLLYHLPLLMENDLHVLHDLGLVSSDENQKGLSVVISNRNRVRCIKAILEHCPRIESSQESSLFIHSIGEALLGIKERSERTRDASFGVLQALVNRAYLIFQESWFGQICPVFLGALAGTSQMQSGAVDALTYICKTYRNEISEDALLQVVSVLLVLLESTSKEVVHSVLKFTRFCIGRISTSSFDAILNSLIEKLMYWAKDSKNPHRRHIRIVLERLIMRFGFDEIRSRIATCPVWSDTKVIDSLWKAMKKLKKEKVESSTRYLEKKERKSLEMRRNKGLILSDALSKTVDLLDSSTKFNLVEESDDDDNMEAEDQEEIAVDDDGRFVIADEDGDSVDNESNDDGLESDSDVDMQGVDSLKITKQAKKKSELPGHNNSRKMKPAKNPDDFNFNDGSRYRAKRAGGDVKVDGAPDPYAFVGFHPKFLNKRMRTQASKQFSGIVKSAERGALKGAKAASKKRSKEFKRQKRS